MVIQFSDREIVNIQMCVCVCVCVCVCICGCMYVIDIVFLDGQAGAITIAYYFMYMINQVIRATKLFDDLISRKLYPMEFKYS